MKCYVIENGLKEGLCYDKLEMERYTKGFSGRKVKKFSSVEKANVYFESIKKELDLKKKKDNEKIYTLIISDDGFNVSEFNTDTKIKTNAKGNISIKYFEGKDNLLKFREQFENKKREKLAKNFMYTISNKKIWYPLFDNEVMLVSNVKKKKQSKTLIAYIDGSYKPCKDIYSSGILFLNGKNQERCRLREVKILGGSKELLKYKNIAGEIVAASYSMKYALKNNFEKLIIYYDCDAVRTFCLENNSFNYLSLIYRTYYNHACDHIDVEFKKVKSHSGNKLNNKAHNLSFIK